MDIGSKGLALLKEFEQGPHGGPALLPYPDLAGRPTIGYGHKIREGEDFSGGITTAQAEELLHQDIAVAVSAANFSLIWGRNQNQFDALVCFIFNVGVTAFRASTMCKLLEADAYAAAAAQFPLWNKTHVDGKLVVVDGLTRRRAAERQLFETPVDAPAPAQPQAQPRSNVVDTDKAKGLASGFIVFAAPFVVNYANSVGAHITLEQAAQGVGVLVWLVHYLFPSFFKKLEERANG